jgi:F0F1-type ATP synthase assembly protein I
MTDRNRAALQVAAVIGAVFGAVTGYLLNHMVESGGWFKIKLDSHGSLARCPL